MAKGNSIALSQEELDRIFGVKNAVQNAPPAAVQKIAKYACKPIATEAQMELLTEICADTTRRLGAIVLKRFFGGDQSVSRKISVSRLEQMARHEFFASVTDNDFLYKIRFGARECFAKLDPFLLFALSGQNADINHTSTVFQSEILKTTIVPLIGGAFAKAANIDPELEISVKSLYRKDLTALKTETTGICAVFLWNENLKVLGVEKLFITKGLFEAVIAAQEAH